MTATYYLKIDPIAIFLGGMSIKSAVGRSASPRTTLRGADGWDRTSDLGLMKTSLYR